ncbi:hypothetical protein NDU88_006332 [Pleurodeles waltl]|uniref:Uncharacterized protein n=1 Tax=Pleurodeles waltl TaxID=8319 RepID=A0AAV7N357_PLEWA|nr:hypothetical protein NDU88_006332 [Pleurodeles waltl]
MGKTLCLVRREDVLYSVRSLVKPRSQLQHETPKGICGACARWHLMAIGSRLIYRPVAGGHASTDFNFYQI